MARILIFLITALLLFGCKKNNPSPVKPTSWIVGKWRFKSGTDTTYYRNGTKTVSAATGGELDFLNAGNVTDNGTYYSYSLESGIDFVSGVQPITKISDTEFRLDHHYYTTDVNIAAEWYVSIYEKE